MPFLSKVAAAALTEAQQAEAAVTQAAQEAAEAAARTHDHDVLLAAARARITAVLGEEADADVLVAEDVDTAERLVVLSDAVTCLAVVGAGDEDAQVWLVKDDAGWTQVTELTSMAELGAALDAGDS